MSRQTWPPSSAAAVVLSQRLAPERPLSKSSRTTAAPRCQLPSSFTSPMRSSGAGAGRTKALVRAVARGGVGRGLGERGRETRATQRRERVHLWLTYAGARRQADAGARWELFWAEQIPTPLWQPADDQQRIVVARRMRGVRTEGTRAHGSGLPNVDG